MKTNRAGLPVLAALIPTRNRPDLLDRALRSIWNQSCKPNILVLVDDARVESGEQSPDFKAIAAFALRIGIETILLRNRRSPGLAGACNTGLDELQRRHPAELVFVAVLDDDDMWKPNHLELCLVQARDRDALMVVSGVIRCDEEHPAGHEHAMPNTLDVHALLTSGQHIQGSNIFLRLDQFLEAGMFSEDLPSCTDRDLCLKLEELGDLRITTTGAHTVIHDAYPRPDRCSAIGSPQKLDGLSGFHRKWRHRMRPDEQIKFEHRSRMLFGWKGPAKLEASPPFDVSTVGDPFEPPAPVTLIAGTTTDSSDPRKIAPLLEWLCELSSRSGNCRVLAVIVENGPRPENGRQPLRTLVDSIGGRGLHCLYVDHERQRADAATGLFEIDADMVGSTRLPIAVTRSIVAVYAAQLAKQPWVKREGEVWVWVLDDEYRPEVLVDQDGIVPKKVPRPDFNELFRLKAEGVDIVLGQLTDAASIPTLTTVRTQLLDLKCLLQTLDQTAAAEPLPDRTHENRVFRSLHADYYYDSARCDCAHLESPMWLSPAVDGEACDAAIQRIAERVSRIAAGEQIFRPLVLSERDIAPDENNILRGGSALFFNPDHLVACPNLLAKADGVYTRRSDMVATILSKECGKLRIVRSWSISGLHDRKQNAEGQADFGSLVDDVHGYALYSTLRELFDHRRQKATISGAALEFSTEEAESTARQYQKLLQERTEALTLSFWRARGLAKTLRRLCAEGESSGKWWCQQRDFVRNVLQLCDWVDAVFTVAKIKDFREKVFRLGKADWMEFSTNLKPRALLFGCLFQQQAPLISEWIGAERCRRAKRIVAQKTGTEVLTFLGQGCEGVVFVHGNRCFKLLDSWSGSREAVWSFLRSKVGAWENTRHLCPLQEWHDLGRDALLVYPFDPSEPYRGGHGQELVGLLRECRQHRVVCRNIHPKNLRVTEGGLRMIDYGADLVPWTEDGFQMMCKRAWLTWRWHHRKDLGEIMRLALTQTDLPELVGFDRFEAAIQKPTALDDLDALLEREVLAAKAHRVLDYGCGKGKLMERLARHGIAVDGYDPDTHYQDRWRALRKSNPTLTVVNQLPQSAGAYEAVVCSLVLCDIADSIEYRRVIRNLRELVSDEGTVFVAICNPFFNFSAATPFHIRRHVPDGANYDRCVSFHECVFNHPTPRLETHRPYRVLERDVLDAGLLVEAVIQTETVDLERFEPASDFLLLRLRPVPRPAHSISLLIKCCAMEGRTIEAQVQHLVRQLETPCAFSERVLVVDSRKDGFLRQYTSGDPDLLLQATRRLLETGWVDRIVHTPCEPALIRSLNFRWFGVDSSFTHTAGGAQVASFLSGLEACTGDYVLHVDSDAIICRQDRRHDYLQEMVAVMDRDPLAVTVALNVAHEQDIPFTQQGPAGPWRVESRAGLVQRERLLSGRPYPNRAFNRELELSWHRSLDRAVQSGRWRSYRGGYARSCFIHPPNHFKEDADAWLLLLDRAERTRFPLAQSGFCDLQTGLEAWLAPKRFEQFVFVICGRDVAPGRFWKCIHSVIEQSRQDWGAIVVDDNSRESSAGFVELLLNRWPDRFTLVRPRLRRGSLANTVLAIRHLCGNPDSVIVTLDADDALLGPSVLDRVAVEYAKGADVTVGSMLRTDKNKQYIPDFHQPRAKRGGNVWQHLRTFKKSLFDQIPNDELLLNGRYVQVAADWAFMLPIVEMARQPVYIPTPLYLYEPSDPSQERRAMRRLPEIEHLAARPARTPAFGAPAEPRPCLEPAT